MDSWSSNCLYGFVTLSHCRRILATLDERMRPLSYAGYRFPPEIAPEQASRPAVDAQAYSQVSHGPFNIRHRQTAFMRGSKSRTAVTDRPRERLSTEQPGRELARPSATTGAEDAAVPVSGIGSGVPLSTCLGLQHVQHLSPSHYVRNEASVPHRGLSRMACRCGHCCLKRRSTTISSTEPINVTNPLGQRVRRLITTEMAAA